jgi:hypothetical protein
MNIHTVAENLRNTIAGKEAYLTRLGNTRDMDAGAAMAVEATRNMLEINIDELKRILADVEVCCEKATADSWALYPDRSGGAFTDEEINRANEWR